MIFRSFTRAFFIASLENKRKSFPVGNDENTVNSAGSRPHDKGRGGGGGGGHPEPEIKGVGGDLPKICFRLFGPQFGLKIRGARLPGPCPGSATGQTSTTGYISITATLCSGQCIYWLLFRLLYNDHISATATFFCSQGGRWGQAQLYTNQAKNVV